MIDNVRRLGYDVNSFSQDIDSLENFYSHPKVNYLGKFRYETRTDYKKGLEYIKEIEKTLVNYEVLFNVKNSVNYLNTFLESEINNDKLLKASEEIITSLSIFETIKEDLGEEMDSIKKSLVSTAYNLIKLEFINNDHSKVLDFVLSDKSYLLDINELVYNEIDNIINSINYIEGVKELKEVFYSSRNLDTIYASDIIFKLLVLCTDREEIKNKLQEKIMHLKNKIGKYTKDLKELNYSGCCKINYIKENNRELKKILNDLKIRLITFVLSGATLASAWKPILKLIKDNMSNELYLTSGIYISQNLGQNSVPQEYLEKFQGDYKVILNISNVLRENENGQYVVTNEKYDVTSIISKEEVYNSPNIDIDSYNLELLDSYEVARMSSMTDEIKEIYKPTYSYTLYEQNLNDKKVEFDSSRYNVQCVLITIVAILILILVELFLSLGERDFSLIVLKKYLDKVKERNVTKENLKEIINEINTLLYENGKLKEEFNSIPLDRRKLIDDYERVLSEINNLLEKNESYKLSL